MKYDRYRHAAGIISLGQEIPAINRKINEVEISRTSPDSLFLIKTLTVMEKKMHAKIYGTINRSISPMSPI